MSMVVLRSKPIGATIPLSVDFISQLVDGEALVSADVTISVFSGVDASADSVLSGSAQLNQNSITQDFTGGVAGVVYLVSFSGGTNYGNSITIQGYLAVLSIDPFVSA